MSVVISVEHLSKNYRLGTINTGTFTGDVHRWWAKLRGQPDPHLKIGEKDHGNRDGETIWALNDVNLEVKQGEVLGIIGKNGAGKSTLLKILSRVTAPTSGEVKVKGRIASLLEVGTGFHPELTGRENIYLNGVILGMKKAEIARKLDEIVDFSGVEQFIDTPVKRYSSGMYVRLAFAVAAHLDPEILIVDEVLAVGDASFQKKCLGKMGDVAHEGRTVLFVSHNMATLQRLCPFTLMLDHGAIVAMGNTQEITTRYLEQGDAAILQWKRQNSPSNAPFFYSISIADLKCQPVSFVTTSDQVRVVLRYVITERTPGLQVSIGLLDATGSQIFGSAPQDAGLSSPEEPGTYEATVILPSGILMPQRYGIRAALWHPHPALALYDRVDAITFNVAETASLANNTAGGRAGILALRCDWSLIQLISD